MHRIIFLLSVISISTCSVFAAQKFEFSKDSEGWSLWGSGDGRHLSSMGYLGQGCLFLQCGKGQTQTTHKRLEGLAPGRYRISAWLRAFDVQEGQYNQAIWLFYNSQGGEAVVSPTESLNGTFEWSRVEYTVDVGTQPLNVWFRLKAPGSLWIDDISIEPYTGAPISYAFHASEANFPKANPVGQGVRCSGCYRFFPETVTTCPFCASNVGVADNGYQAATEAPPVRMLIDFEGEDAFKKRSYIRERTSDRATEGEYAGQIQYGSYNNLRLDTPEMSDWSGYDYVALDIYNPLSKQVPFAMQIGDDQGGGYWNNLNYYTRLSPGWNKLRFHVNRYVGERGSVRVERYLNLSKIKRFWFGIDPEKRGGDTSAAFLVDNLRLLKAPPAPQPFKGLQCFDFVKERIRAQNGFLAIQEQHRYHKDIGFGFDQAEIWRAHDSVYADTLNRDGIFVNKGRFLVDVPNGRYKVLLNVEVLGEWYEHFWSHRTVTIQGTRVMHETQESIDAYLENFLRFQDVIPEPGDDPYSLYLEPLFKPLEAEVTVTDGQLEISFVGDNSGICLNWLVLYPVSQEASGKRYMDALQKVLHSEFTDVARQLEPTPRGDSSLFTQEHKQSGFYTALIPEGELLRYNQILPSLGSAIQLRGGIGQRPVQALMVRPLKAGGKLSITPSPLKNAAGDTIQVQPDWVRYGVNQFICHSFNHETYEIAPRFLRDFPASGLSVKKEASLYLWYQIPLAQSAKPGTYTGTLTLRLGNGKTVYPVSLEVMPFTLPPVDIPAGYFGLDPISFNHVTYDDVDKYKQEMRKRVLQALHDRGFTTWSTLPDATLKQDQGTWVIDAPAIDVLMTQAKELGFKAAFTYGGGLDSILKVDAAGNINAMTNADYRQASAVALKAKFANSSWLPIIFNYSDEASGYSQKVDRDLERAKVLANHYPFLRRGGFTHAIPEGQPGFDLNMTFTDGSYSSITKAQADHLTEKGMRWGLYNQGIHTLTDGRATFGRNLFAMRCNGCTHIIQWHLTLSQNYPYYDLDGRENDAMMIFPRKDGAFEYAIRFEQAAQGLEDYRLLLLLEQLASNDNERGEAARVYLSSTYNKPIDNFDRFDETYSNLRAFRDKVYSMIFELIKY